MFCTFTPLKPPKKSKFWKNEKNCGTYHHFTHGHQKPQSYDVQFLRYRETDRIFCHFGPFLVLLPLTTEKIKIVKKWKKHLDMSSFYTCVPKIKNHDMVYASWDWTISCPFTPNNMENQNFLKNKKALLDMPSFYTCVPKIKNHDHMVYASWDMDWDIFGPFTTPNSTLENQNLKKMKKNS